MELALAEEQVLVRDAIRDLVEKEVGFDRIRELELESRMDEPLWRTLAGFGWLGLPVPEDAGGGGGSLADVAIVVEELCRRAAMVPYAEAMAVAATLLRFGEGDVASRTLPDLIAGRDLLLPAVLDDGDSYEHVIEGSADEAGRVTARRISVDYGQYATSLLLAIPRPGGAGADLHLAEVDGSTTVTPIANIARTPVALAELRGAPATLVTQSAGYRFLVEAARALSAIACLGYAQKAFDMALDYVKNRVQFGRPLGSFQAVQHHCANMAIQLQAARFMAYEAAWAVGEGSSTAEQVALAKGFAARSAIEVTALAHQLHGGIGITAEYDLHFFGRRAKERAMAWGTTDEALTIVARGVHEPDDWSR